MDEKPGAGSINEKPQPIKILVEKSRNRKYVVRDFAYTPNITKLQK